MDTLKLVKGIVIGVGTVAGVVLASCIGKKDDMIEVGTGEEITTTFEVSDEVTTEE